MTKIIDVVEAFVYNGPLQCTANDSMHNRNGFIGDNRKLFSYNTCIGEYDNGIFYVNVTKYSQTTTRHQNILAGILDQRGRKYKEIINVPIGAQSLKGGETV